MEDDSFDYAQFPHRKLSANVNRRQFLQSLVNEMRSARPNQQDHPVFKLSDMGEMPDADLAWVVPMPYPGSKIVQRDGVLWGQPAMSKQEVNLFPAESPAGVVFLLFDGQKNIAHISRIVAKQMEWNLKYAFAYVRGVFLKMVLIKILAPKMTKEAV